MANEWIIDVIADLRTYATHNGLAALARQLDDATLIAAMEIASRDGGTPNVDKWEIGDLGLVSGANCRMPERLKIYRQEQKNYANSTVYGTLSIIG